MTIEPVRAFVAVQLTEEVTEALWDVQSRLKNLDAMHGLKWVDPYHSHITLKFLGDTPIPQLPQIVEALDRMAEKWEPFEVELQGLGAFPNVHRPNVLWVGVEEGQKALVHLYNAVEVALKKIGFKPERSEFFPHVTLARVPRHWTQTQQRAMGDLIGPSELPEIPPFVVDAVALMRSTLTPDGAVYTRLGESVFGEAPPLEDDDWEDEE